MVIKTKQFADLATGARFATVQIGDLHPGHPILVWAHGWGQSLEAFLPVADRLRRFAPSFLFDFPGFGQSPPPDAPWGTAEYADAVAELLSTLPPGPRIWIGHSFGCRVGLQIASRNPDVISHMILIAAAGLPRRRSILGQLKFRARVLAFKFAKQFTKEGPGREKLRARFGSNDYRDAGSMRGIFLKVINEDLTEVARAVRCTVRLIYGTEDVDTPPEIGRRLKHLIPDSSLLLLRGYDHLSILSRGRDQIAKEINVILDSIAK